MAPTSWPRSTVLNVSFYAGSLTKAVSVTIDRALSGQGGYISLTEVHGLTLAQRDPAIKDALDRAWMNLPDGVPVTWVQHRTGAPKSQRVAGGDLMPRVLDRGQDAGLRHFLLGSTNDVLSAAHRQILRKWPQARVVGTHSPPFAPVEGHAHDGCLQLIRDADPHIVWLGLGTPKQDLWGRSYARAVRPALVVGVGAAFDFVAGTKTRAPLWMQRSGLEWLHRLASEPGRLGPRYLQSNSAFIAYLVADLARSVTSVGKP